MIMWTTPIPLCAKRNAAQPKSLDGDIGRAVRDILIWRAARWCCGQHPPKEIRHLVMFIYIVNMLKINVPQQELLQRCRPLIIISNWPIPQQIQQPSADTFIVPCVPQQALAAVLSTNALTSCAMPFEAYKLQVAKGRSESSDGLFIYREMQEKRHRATINSNRAHPRSLNGFCAQTLHRPVFVCQSTK